MMMDAPPWAGFEPDVLNERCPSRELLAHVSSKWGALVLIALEEDGTLRFSALRRRVGGVSERMLSQTLKVLEADGFVRRVAHDAVPPHVEYSLTPHGRGVAGHVKALALWLEANLPSLPAGAGARQGARAG